MFVCFFCFFKPILIPVAVAADHTKSVSLLLLLVSLINPLDLPIHINKIGMRLSILYGVSQIEISK